MYHLLDMSKGETHWNWENHFGFYPALLLTLETKTSNEIECDYPDKDTLITRLVTLEAFKNSLE